MHRPYRLIAAAFALLHLAMAGFGPIADARLEAVEQNFRTHVESERSRPCSAGHDHLFCQICRVIGVQGVRTETPPLVQTATALRFTVAQNLLSVISRITLVAHGPRPPPVA